MSAMTSKLCEQSGVNLDKNRMRKGEMYMEKKRCWTIQFHDGEKLTICADWLEQSESGLFDRGGGFFSFVNKDAETKETQLVATVQCAYVKYMTVESEVE